MSKRRKRQTQSNMTKVRAYFRLAMWKWAKSKQTVIADYPSVIEDEDEITEFDLSPYLGWMEKERQY